MKRKVREYETYEEYLKHQGSKLLQRRDWIDEWDVKHEHSLKHRLNNLRFIKPGLNVLCLGARRGGEVRAFKAVGCSAIGIDVSPGENNPDVMKGDFHKLPFNDNSFNVVYCNCLDHALDVKAVIREIQRVLKYKGVFILEVAKMEGIEPDEWAVTWWDGTDDVIGLFWGTDLMLFETHWYIEERRFNKESKQFCFSMEAS